MADPRYPALYQINTRVWLTELSQKLGRRATLDDIPDAELDRLAELGFDWVWFLSVWQTGPAAQAISRSQRRVAPGVSGDAAGLAGRRHRRLRVRHPKLHRASRSRRRCGAGPFAPAAATTRTEADARLCPEPHGAGSPVDRRAPGLLCPWQRDRPGPRAAELLPGANDKTDRWCSPTAATRIFDGWPDTLQLNYGNPALAAGDDRRAGEHRRAMRRRALRHGDAGLARRVRTHLGHPG